MTEEKFGSGIILPPFIKIDFRLIQPNFPEIFKKIFCWRRKVKKFVRKLVIK